LPALARFSRPEPGRSGALNEAGCPGSNRPFGALSADFLKALTRIEEALALDRGDLRGQILLSKSHLHETLGEPEASSAAPL